MLLIKSKLKTHKLWTEEFQQEMIDLVKEGVELEYQYAHDTMPHGILGMNARNVRRIFTLYC